MKKEIEIRSGGLGYFLFIALALLQLTNFINISWWWITLPLTFPIVIGLLFPVIVMVVAAMVLFAVAIMEWAVNKWTK